MKNAQRFESRGDRLSRIFRYLLSVAMAIFIYISFSFSSREVRKISIPLVVVPNSQYTNNSNIDASVDLEVLGDPSIIYKVNPDKIKAYLDCTVVDKEGMWDIAVTLDYELGLLDGARVEIVNKDPVMRISFVRR